MSATELARPPQTAFPVTHEFAEERTMRGPWFGLLIAVPCWLILALLIIAVFQAMTAGPAELTSSQARRVPMHPCGRTW